MLSCVLLFANPWTVACPGSPVDGILQARILEWVGLLFPSPGHLPDPGVVLGSPALQTDSLLSEPPGRPLKSNYFRYIIGLFPILAMERTYFVWLLFFEFVDVCFTTQTIVCLGQSAISSLKKKKCVSCCCWADCTINFNLVKLFDISGLPDPYWFSVFWNWLLREKWEVSMYTCMFFYFFFYYNSIWFMQFEVLLVANPFLGLLCFLDELISLKLCDVPLYPW